MTYTPVYCSIGDVRRIMRIESTEDPPDADVTDFIEEAEGSVIKEFGSITADAVAQELCAKIAALSITGPNPYNITMGGVQLTIYPSEWMRRVDYLRGLLRSPKVKSRDYQTDKIADTWEET